MSDRQTNSALLVLISINALCCSLLLVAVGSVSLGALASFFGSWIAGPSAAALASGLVYAVRRSLTASRCRTDN